MVMLGNEITKSNQPANEGSESGQNENSNLDKNANILDHFSELDLRNNSLTENFLASISVDDANKLLKYILTLYNDTEMPSELQKFVELLQEFVKKSNELFDLSELTPQENAEMKKLVSLSKSPNRINYLENSTYKKYLNIVERELNLPKYALESICSVESSWLLYKDWKYITWSVKWAQWLFQFMPDTAKTYFQNSKLKQYYWKTFSSTIEFLKDPLATAWAAWIMLNNYMGKYDFQTSLACYNWWEGHYQSKILGKNGMIRSLTIDDFGKLPGETKNYVVDVTRKLLEKNSLPYNDNDNNNQDVSDVFTDLSNCMWNLESVNWSSMG